MLSHRGHDYDDLAPVHYHLRPAAFCRTGRLTRRVATVAEPDGVLAELDSHDGAAHIEVMIPNEESQPLPASIVDRGYTLNTP